MALDGVTLAHLIQETRPLLSGARIDKIHQPEKEEIHFILRQQGQTLRLLLNASATASRLHLTGQNKKNPASPPMFCMILRKHLEGGKILQISQENLERTVTFAIQNYNEYGDLKTYHLHLEIMGKHSNLLLTDPDSNTILDGLKRYSHAVSHHREVLPGRPYIAPPDQGKHIITQESHWQRLLLGSDLNQTLSKLLVQLCDGVSPDLAREIIVRSGLDLNVRLSACGEVDLNRLFQNYLLLGNPCATDLPLEPCLYFDPPQSGGLSGVFRVPVAFSFTPYQQYFGLTCQRLKSLQHTVASFYELKNDRNQLEARRNSLARIVQDLLSHLTRKLANYEESMCQAKSSLNHQKHGELLIANLYRLSAGMTEITAQDLYEESLPELTIPLDPLLSGIENAQRYFRLYYKAKSTLNNLSPMHTSVSEESQYLQTLQLFLAQASDLAELNDIHQELVQQGYIAAKHKGGKHKRAAQPEPSKPRCFSSSQGRLIFVGKNNQQNEYLSLRQGQPKDLWLHVKNTPGSHVLIPLAADEEFPDDRTLEEAAALAVFFSQARGSSQVAVDYTHVKNLKKPKGSKPGMVIYRQNWTLYLTPRPEDLTALLQSATAMPDERSTPTEQNPRPDNDSIRLRRS
ncbi:MAG: NFACT family protein [Peptococcaceae bacterium]|nr:NFACT family protein [Peptococcaceae bacterium]